MFEYLYRRFAREGTFVRSVPDFFDAFLSALPPCRFDFSYAVRSRARKKCRFVADRFYVGALHAVDEFFRAVVFYERDRTSSETRSRHARADA